MKLAAAFLVLAQVVTAIDLVQQNVKADAFSVDLTPDTQLPGERRAQCK